MSDYQDTEITLGTGRLLALFFGLVLVCSIFFGLGFTMGRSAAASGGPVTLAPAVPSVETPRVAHSGAKPGAARDVPAAEPAIAVSEGAPASAEPAADTAKAEPAQR